MSSALDELDLEIYSESWEYLNRDYIPFAKKVQKAVAEGIAPEVIRRRVIGTAGAHREAIAIRCEHAARYLYAIKQKGT